MTLRNEKIKDQLWYALATAGYVGLVPVGPGTAGSLVATLALWWVPSGYPITWAAVTAVVFAIGVVASGNVERCTGIIDPSFVVVDEVVGMAVTLWLLPKSILWYAIAFGLFRFFDIVKPFPIKIVERRLPGGWGVMTDDLVAAGMAWVIVQALVRLF